MSEVLRRKLGARRASERTNAVSVETVLRKTMPRDADRVLALDVVVTQVVGGTVHKEQLLEAIGPHHLVYLAEDEKEGRGIITLDPDLMSALIEVQVSGKVSKKPVVERAPTRTDGIVAGEIIDAWVATAETAMPDAGLDTTWPMLGFERVAGKVSRREVDLSIEPVEFRTVEIILSLDGGAKMGSLFFATPRHQALIEGQSTTTAARVRSHLPSLPVELRAVLARLPVDMKQAESLATDTILPLPDGCLQQVRIETRDGHCVRSAKLGQLEGAKAVRFEDIGRSKDGPPALAVAEAGTLGSPEATVADAALDLPGPLEMPPAPAMAPTGDLPELPDLPDPGALPDLPDLPDLPELPELPDLP